MNVLMVGISRAGSWTIRGEELGAALGARRVFQPTGYDLAWADVVVLVKRAYKLWRPGMTKAAVVWDTVDFWEQPAQNGYDEKRARVLLKSVLDQVQPDLVIGATEAMAEAAGGICLPHHAQPLITAAPARETVQMVAYQGNPNYLGRWHGWLTEACQKRGWSFVVNPDRLSDADIVVALRDGHWDGWMPREWKSGVKYANAMAAGRPVITQPTAAWREMQPVSTAIESQEQLDGALDRWESHIDRHSVWQAYDKRNDAYTVKAIAATYRTHLEALTCPA